jgi:hypothetical protein
LILLLQIFVYIFSRQVSLLGVRRVSLAPGIPANQTTPLTTSPSYPIWGEGTKVAEVEHTVPPPSPPSWAEMVRRGTTLPLGQPLSHTPPGPASRHPPLSLLTSCSCTRTVWRGGFGPSWFLRQVGVERNTVSSAVPSQEKQLQQQQQQQQQPQQQLQQQQQTQQL